jgi:hypothetical protein
MDTDGKKNQIGLKNSIDFLLIGSVWNGKKACGMDNMERTGEKSGIEENKRKFRIKNLKNKEIIATHRGLHGVIRL